MRLRLLATLLFVFTLFSHAQFVSPSSQRPTDADLQRIRELLPRAQQLADQAVNEADRLSPENGLMVRAQVLPLIWERDAARGRELLARITSDIQQLREMDDDDEEPRFAASQRYMMARQQVFSVLSREPDAALQFLRDTRDDDNPSVDDHLEMQLAQQIASRDPARAAAIARKALNGKDLPWQVVSIAVQLREKAPDQAAKLNAEILNKLRTRDFATDQQALNIAWNYLNGPQGRSESTPPGTMELATSVVNALLRSPQGHNFLMGSVDRLAELVPSKAAALRAKRDQIAKSDPQMAMMMRRGNNPGQQSIDQSLKDLEQLPPEQRNGQLGSVAMMAANSGELVRAREIALSIPDRSQRENALNMVVQQAASRAVMQKNYSAARTLVNDINRRQARGHALASLASQASRENPVIARQWLSEAAALLPSPATGRQSLQSVLWVAHVAAQVDSALTLSLLDGNIDQINQVLAGAAEVDNFLPLQSFERGELLLSRGMLFATLVSPYVEVAAVLAATNFDRARAAVDRLARPEARAYGHATIASRLYMQSQGQNSPGFIQGFGGGYIGSAVGGFVRSF